MFNSIRLRIDQEVATGNADVDGAGTHVDSNVAGTDEEELNSVDLVEEHEFLRVTALAVASFPEKSGCGFGKRALIGHSNTQH